MKKPFLLVDADAGEVRLLTLRQALQRMTDDEGDTLTAILDLGKCASVFDRRAKDKQQWSIIDLMAVTGQQLRTVDSWTRAGIIPCSVRPGDGKRGRNGQRIYSRQDAYIAAIVATVRRNVAMPLPLLKRVSELLADASEPIVDVVDIERN